MGTPSYQKAKDKMAIGKPLISIITLNVNRLSSQIKRHRVAECIKKNKNVNHMLPPGDTSQFQRQIQTQSERVENDISCKWHSEKSVSSSSTNFE